MILDMIHGCWYLGMSTDRWLLSKNSTTRIEGLESWHGVSWLWNCSIPITNTKGLFLYPDSNTTPSRPRLQYLLPKSTPWHHVHLVSIINSSPSLYPIHVIMHSRMLPLSSVEQLSCRMTMYSRPQMPLPNAMRKNLLPNGVLLPNSSHMSVSSLYQCLVLTLGPDPPTSQPTTAWVAPL
jgi:hypothetical protein